MSIEHALRDDAQRLASLALVVSADVKAQADEITRLRSLLREAGMALKPFVEASAHYGPGIDGNRNLDFGGTLRNWTDIRVSDLRLAAEVARKIEESKP